MSTTPDPDPANFDPTLAAAVRLAIADLARRTGLRVDEIAVREARRVTWPDGSLGCPQPGQMYTQALVPGLLIRLAAGSRSYEYHRGRGGAPFLCDPLPPAAGPLPPADV